MPTSATRTPSAGLSYLRDEEIRLREEPVLPRVAPDRRQHEIGEHIGERAIAQDVIGRRALAVGEAAAAEEGEGRVDLAGHQQEDEDRAEAAAADGPLLQAHLLAAPRQEAERERQQRRGGDDDERAVHGSSSRLAGSAA